VNFTFHILPKQRAVRPNSAIPSRSARYGVAFCIPRHTETFCHTTFLADFGLETGKIPTKESTAVMVSQFTGFQPFAFAAFFLC
jgi:hypothetical protein